MGWNNDSAVLYENGIAVDLNSLISPGSSFTLNRANAINDAGAIVGNGQLAGNTHAFLLTPVPEPGSITLLLCGLASLALLRRRR